MTGLRVLLVGVCLALSACGTTEADFQEASSLATQESELLVKQCPGYGACTNWSAWEYSGSTCEDAGGACGYECVPIPNRPRYCAFQIEPTLGDCCQALWPNPGTYATQRRYRWCADAVGNWCDEIEQQTAYLEACGC